MYVGTRTTRVNVLYLAVAKSWKLSIIHFIVHECTYGSKGYSQKQVAFSYHNIFMKLFVKVI